jgi:hypothetical protein
MNVKLSFQIVVLALAFLGLILPWLHEKLVDRWRRTGKLPGYMNVEGY